VLYSFSVNGSFLASVPVDDIRDMIVSKESPQYIVTGGNDGSITIRDTYK
jgi:hypothetical protein